MTRTIHEAREDKQTVMNINDMIAVARASTSDAIDWAGENKNTLAVLAAYYGGFNTSAGESYNRLRAV